MTGKGKIQRSYTEAVTFVENVGTLLYRTIDAIDHMIELKPKRVHRGILNFIDNTFSCFDEKTPAMTDHFLDFRSTIAGCTDENGVPGSVYRLALYHFNNYVREAAKNLRGVIAEAYERENPGKSYSDVVVKK